MKKINLPMEEVYHLYQNGVSCVKIAEDFHCSISFVYKKLQAYKEKTGFVLIKQSPNQSVERSIKRIYELYQAGKTYHELADMYHCSYRTIFRKLHKYCDENHLKLDSHDGEVQLQLTIEEIYRLYQSGESGIKLANLMGCASNTLMDKLHKYCDENNLRLRITPTHVKWHESCQGKSDMLETIPKEDKRTELLNQLRSLLQMSQQLSESYTETVGETIKSKKKRLN